MTRDATVRSGAARRGGARILAAALAVALGVLSLLATAPARAEVTLRPADQFGSTGDEIEGWFWLRDAALSQSAEYIFRRVPKTGDLILEISALATDRPSGGGGFPARFDLLFGFPGSGRMGGVFHAIEVELPNVSAPDDALGYLTRGAIVLPRDKLAQVLPPSGELFIRIVRHRAEDPHVAFNATSLRLRLETVESATDEQPGGSGEDGSGAGGSGAGGQQPPTVGELPETATAETAGLITPGGYLGSLSSADDEADWYAVEMERGQVLELLLALPEGMNASLRLLTPQGAVRRNTLVYGGVTGQVRFAAEDDGAWLVQIVRRRGEGDYGLQLTVENQDDAGLGIDADNRREDAVPVDVGALSGELLRGDDDDWYRVALEAGDVLDLQLAAPEGARLSLQLAAPEGGVRKTVTIHAAAAGGLRYAADRAGDWLVRVRRLAGEGRYALTLDVQHQADGGGFGDAAGSADEAGPIEPGPQLGLLLQRDDRDVYVVAAERGDIIQLEGQSTSESLRLGLHILAPGGGRVVSDAVRPFGSLTLRYAATRAGEWYADLRRIAGAGPYGVQVEVLPQDDGGSGQDAGPCGESPVALAAPVTDGWLLRGDYLDCYSLSLAANEQVSIALSTDDRVGASLTLRTAGGTVVGAAADADGSGRSLTFGRDTAVETSIIVRRTAGDGPYRLDVSFTPPRGGAVTADGTGGTDDTGGTGGTDDTGGTDGTGGTGGTGGEDAASDITVTVADGGRRLVADRPFQVTPGGPLDLDGDGLHQRWEDLAFALAAPTLELDEEEDWLVRRPGHHLQQFVRVTPYPNASQPTHVLFYFVMAWTRDYGRFATGFQPWDESVAIRHNGDLERAILGYRIADERTLDLVAVFTSAHGGETNHSGVWAAEGETCNIGVVKLGLDEQICATLEFPGNRLRLQISEDKHAVYPTAAACEQVQLVFRASVPYVGGETGFGEDCGGGGTLVAPSANVGEPDQPIAVDLAAIFPGEEVWTGDGFCGGRGSTYDSNLPCVGPVRGHLESPSPLLTEALAGRYPQMPSLLDEALGQVEEGVDTVLDWLPDIQVPSTDIPDIDLQGLGDLFDDLF